MKKKIIIILLLVLGAIVGFSVKSGGNSSKENGRALYSQGGSKVYVYTIDGCEYIGMVGGYGVDWLVHKGNCSFCAKRRAQETEKQKASKK